MPDMRIPVLYGEGEFPCGVPALRCGQQKELKNSGQEMAPGTFPAALINPQRFFINGERVHAQVFRTVCSHFFPDIDDVHPAALAFAGTVADARFLMTTVLPPMAAASLVK